MGIFDEIDDAFDFMMGGEDDKSEKPQANPEPDPTLIDAMGDLKLAIAEEKLIPVLGLLEGLDRFRRAHVLAGLHGAASHLQGVEIREDRKNLLNRVLELLTTRKQTVRRVLSKSQRQAIGDLAHQLRGETATKPTPQLVSLLNACIATDDWQPDDTRALFADGIWQASQVIQAEDGMIERITGIGQTKIGPLTLALKSE